jgi:hypothetical protein
VIYHSKITFPLSFSQPITMVATKGRNLRLACRLSTICSPLGAGCHQLLSSERELATQEHFGDPSVQRNLSLKLDGLHGTASNVQDKKKHSNGKSRLSLCAAEFRQLASPFISYPHLHLPEFRGLTGYSRSQTNIRCSRLDGGLCSDLHRPNSI